MKNPYTFNSSIEPCRCVGQIQTFGSKPGEYPATPSRGVYVDDQGNVVGYEGDGADVLRALNRIANRLENARGEDQMGGEQVFRLAIREVINAIRQVTTEVK